MSQVTYVTVVPRVGKETLRPLGFGPCLGSKHSDEEVDDVFSRCPLYYGRAGSDVIGCHRPTGGVLYMYASDTKTLEQGTEPQTAPRASHRRLLTAPSVCALGWVKCREHISLLVIFCII